MLVNSNACAFFAPTAMRPKSTSGSANRSRPPDVLARKATRHASCVSPFKLAASTRHATSATPGSAAVIDATHSTDPPGSRTPPLGCQATSTTFSDVSPFRSTGSAHAHATAAFVGFFSKTGAASRVSPNASAAGRTSVEGYASRRGRCAAPLKTTAYASTSTRPSSLARVGRDPAAADGTPRTISVAFVLARPISGGANATSTPRRFFGARAPRLGKTRKPAPSSSSTHSKSRGSAPSLATSRNRENAPPSGSEA